MSSSLLSKGRLGCCSSLRRSVAVRRCSKAAPSSRSSTFSCGTRAIVLGAFRSGAPELVEATDGPEPDLESRMVRYRFGPWDPAYYALLGRLIGKGLVRPATFARGIGYRATDKGRALALAIGHEPAWVDTAERIKLLHQHFDLSGANLKKFIYEHFPEVTQATWGESL